MISLPSHMARRAVSSPGTGEEQLNAMAITPNLRRARRYRRVSPCCGWRKEMKHVVLVGDSVFDNAAYVGGGPDVVRQLRRALPEDWQATLRAVDGATTASVARQVESL